LTTHVPGYTWQGWSLTKDGAVVAPTEAFAEDTTLYARYSFTPRAHTPPATLTFDIPFDMHPLRTAVPNDWIRGADISNCWEIEQYGGEYKNFNGQVEDIMKILVDNGVNYVRLRLWVDPEAMTNHYPGDGNTKMAVIKVIAARAKAAGMKFLLAYHYSDYWADPGQQFVPVSWNVTTKQALITKLADYTSETIQEFIDAGARPDMVALGNEVRSGLLRTRRPNSAVSTPAPANQALLNSWTDYAQAFDAASKAVRAIDNNIKIMIQFDQGGASNTGGYDQFTQRANGAASETGVNVDYDIIGLSWYTYWSSHGSLSGLYTQIGSLKSRYGKDVVVCESGFAYNYGTDFDYPPGRYKVNFKPGFSDNLANVYGIKNAGVGGLAVTQLNNNTQRFVSDSGIPYSITEFPGNPEYMARGYRAMMDAVAAAGGAGVMWWGADWFAPVMGLNSNVENSALWDDKGVALPALRVLGGIKGPDVAKPGKVTGLTASISGGTTATLSWDTVNSAITNRYRIERATSDNGPWETVKDNINSPGDGANTRTATGTDAGLTAGTTYYYRVSAYNNNGWGTPSDTKNVTAEAFSFGTPAGLAVGSTTDSSIRLTWTAVPGAASYKVYGAQATAEPADDTAYTVVGSPTGTTYTHGSLTVGDTWWYKVAAVYTPEGDGPKSVAVSGTAAEPPPTTYTLSVVISLDPSEDAVVKPDEVVIIQGGWNGGTNWGQTNNATYKLTLQTDGTWTGTIPDIPYTRLSFNYNLYAEKNTVNIGSNGRPDTAGAGAMKYAVLADRPSNDGIPFTHSGGATGVLTRTVTAWDRPPVVEGNLLGNASFEDGTTWDLRNDAQAPWRFQLGTNGGTGAMTGWLVGSPQSYTGRAFMDFAGGNGNNGASWINGTLPRDVTITQSVSVGETGLAVGVQVTLSCYIRRYTTDQSNVKLLVGAQEYDVTGDLTTNTTNYQQVSHTFTLTAADFTSGSLTNVGLKYTAALGSTCNTYVDEFVLVITE
jgi:arabinogalactan endo-1,4-beta-galactosidase